MIKAHPVVGAPVGLGYLQHFLVLTAQEDLDSLLARSVCGCPVPRRLGLDEMGGILPDQGQVMLSRGLQFAGQLRLRHLTQVFNADCRGARNLPK